MPPSPLSSQTTPPEDHDTPPATSRILDTLYPLTHFLGHRPPTVEADLQPGDEGYRALHARFAYTASLRWLDPLAMYSEKRRWRQDAYGGGGRAGVDAWDRTRTGHKHHKPSLSKKLPRLHTPNQPSWDEGVGWMFWGRVKHTIHSCIAVFAILAFCTMIARSRYWTAYHAPILLAGLSTEAIITFSLYDIPSAQPAAILLANTLSTIIGVAIQKAFQNTTSSYSPGDVFGVNWAAPCTAVMLTQLIMNLLGVTHPPGAALATLATTTSNVVGEAWQLVPQVLLLSLLFVAWALLMNNIGGRQYPKTWSLPFYPEVHLGGGRNRPGRHSGSQDEEQPAEKRQAEHDFRTQFHGDASTLGGRPSLPANNEGGHTTGADVEHGPQQAPAT